MVAAPEIVAELNANGFAIVEGVLSEDETLRLLVAISQISVQNCNAVEKCLRFETCSTSFPRSQSLPRPTNSGLYWSQFSGTSSCQ
jgi:hypothetical protein